MAQIVLGLGTSHGPQLFLRPEQWEVRAQADRQNPQHWFRGKAYDFPALTAARRNEDFSSWLTPVGKQAHFDRCQRAIGAIADVYETTAPDIAVIEIAHDRSETKEDRKPLCPIRKRLRRSFDKTEDPDQSE